MGSGPSVLVVCLVSLALAGCTGGGSESGEPGRSSSSTAATQPSPSEGDPKPAALPRTPVGTALAEALSELREGPLSAADYRRLFADRFRRQVPLGQINQLAGTDIAVEEVRVGSAPNYLTATATVPGLGDAVVTAAAAATPEGSRLSTFAVTPATPPAAPAPGGLTTWRRVDGAAGRLAPLVALETAEVAEGECRAEHAADPDAAMPLASTMKLWVLGALAHAAADGTLGWDDRLTLTDAQRSLPGGVLQDTRGTVPTAARDAAGLMISISDNTATDLLIDRLGPARVRAYAKESGASQLDSLTPYLDTSQLFALRLNDFPALAERYQGAGPRGRAALLASPRVRRDPSAAEIAAWTTPRWTSGPGWRGTAADLCAAWARLDGLTGREAEEVDAVLSLNDGGLRLDREQWPRVWFKGGSEVGVLALSFLAEHQDGHVYVSSLLLADPRAPLAERTVAPRALDVVRAALALAAQG